MNDRMILIADDEAELLEMVKSETKSSGMKVKNIKNSVLSLSLTGLQQIHWIIRKRSKSFL